MDLNTTIQVIDTVPDPMLILSGEGEIKAANPPAIAGFGDWILGRNYGAVLRQPSLVRLISDALVTGRGGETRIERPDGALVTEYRVRVSPLNPAPASPVVLHFADVTPLHAAEAIHRDFVANVSHELRTPLTSVLGFIETLRGPARDDPEAQERFLSIMEDEARRMNRLVSDLLSLSRVEQDARRRPQGRVDLYEIVQNVRASLRPLADEIGTTIDLDWDFPTPDGAKPEPPGLHLPGDHDQLTQVFLNLAENAVKYAGHAGPVRIAVRRGALKAPGEGGGSVAVSVIDQGEGIDPLHLPRLTERFYRVDTHRSREMGGTGLGLAIVKHIVNRHRGGLKIVSRNPVGTTFKVELPMA